MKIVQILDKGSFNTGSVHQMYALASALHERGHDVIVVGKPGSEVEEACLQKKIPYRALPFKGDFDASTISGLRRLFKEEKVEVVHAHKGRPHTLALFASSFSPVKCFVANRGVSFPLTIWNRGKYRTSRCHRVICVCDAIRSTVIQSGKISPEKVVTVYAGTDLIRFNPNIEDGRALREKLGYGEEEIVICQIGLREWRGWRTLVEAFGKLAPEVPEARLLLVAAKDEEHIEVIRELSALHGVEEKTRILGYRSDVPAISAAQDIAGDFSYAGLGVTGTLREGMAMGSPVVCSSAGGNPELVIHGETGLLVPPNDPEATADALRRMLKDPEMRKKMGAAGRSRVVKGFSTKIRVKKIEKLYREVLDRE